MNIKHYPTAVMFSPLPKHPWDRKGKRVLSPSSSPWRTLSENNSGELHCSPVKVRGTATPDSDLKFSRLWWPALLTMELREGTLRMGVEDAWVKQEPGVDSGEGSRFSPRDHLEGCGNWQKGRSLETHENEGPKEDPMCQYSAQSTLLLVTHEKCNTETLVGGVE